MKAVEVQEQKQESFDLKQEIFKYLPYQFRIIPRSIYIILC